MEGRAPPNLARAMRQREKEDAGNSLADRKREGRNERRECRGTGSLRGDLAHLRTFGTASYAYESKERSILRVEPLLFAVRPGLRD